MPVVRKSSAAARAFSGVHVPKAPMSPLAHQPKGHCEFNADHMNLYHCKLFLNRVENSGESWVISVTLVVNADTNGCLIPKSAELTPAIKENSVYVRTKTSFTYDELAPAHKALQAKADWCTAHPEALDDAVRLGTEGTLAECWFVIKDDFALQFDLKEGKTKEGKVYYRMGEPFIEGISAAARGYEPRGERRQ